MNIKQISVFVENKPGALYAMTGVLAQNQIDMRALNVAESSDFGVARVIVDDVYKVAIPDVPGGLNKVLQVLTDAKVNVEYMYAFLGGKDTTNAYMVFRVADNEAAAAALASRSIKTVDQEEMNNL